MDARRHESEEVLYVSAGGDDDSHRRLRRHGLGEKRARREGRNRDLGRQVYGRRGFRSDDEHCHRHQHTHQKLPHCHAPFVI